MLQYVVDRVDRLKKPEIFAGLPPLTNGEYLGESMNDMKKLPHSITHGKSKTPEHVAWLGIRQRCTNPKNKDFDRYGGRGISICDEWAKFENFIRDMGNKPSSKHSIERRDNGGDYSPDNCKWATRVEQNRNQRVQKNSILGIKGIGMVQTGRNVRYNPAIGVNGKSVYLGSFKELKDAVSARINGELKYWGRASEGKAYQE